MSDDQPSGRVRFVRALSVPRNARIGVATGLAVGVGAYLYRVLGLLGPVPGARGSPLLFAMLAFVLAANVAVLVTAVLTILAAVRLARESR